MKRAAALDALRGCAILAMVFSAEIPEKVLPSWMYHAQVPPPLHVYDGRISGITWVDLVFPFFLFSLGAAIPLALSRRLQVGKTWSAVLRRGLLLSAFAIVVEHLRPGVLFAQEGAASRLTALLGFGLLFLAFARLNGGRALTALGWLGLAVFLALRRYPDGTGFSLDRSDIILVLLANGAFFGSLAWLGTRGSALARLGVLGALLAVRLSSPQPGWLAWLYEHPPLGFIFQWRYVQYLFIVLPGTLAGERLLEFLKSEGSARGAWGAQRKAALAAVMLSSVAACLVGLKARLVGPTTAAAALLCLAAERLTSAPASRRERLARELFVWGAYWLMLGLLFEPFEGGIKKDPPSMSYYFVNSGLALFLLTALTTFEERLESSRAGRLLIANGQNPMLAYVGMENLIRPLLALTGLEAVLLRLTPTPWLGVLGGALTTLLLALVVGALTRRGIFWRT